MNIKALLSLFVIIAVLLHGCKKADQNQGPNIKVDAFGQDTLKVLEYIKLANTYTNNIPDSATYYASEALQLSKTINYNRGVALGYYYMGIAEWAKGNYPQSLNYFKITLEHTTSKKIRGLTLRDISLSLIYLDRTEDAKTYLNESIEIFKALDDKFALTLAYVNYGMIEGKNGNYLLSLGHYQEALKLSEETQSLTNKSLVLNNLGVINSKLEMHNRALENYKQAYAIVKGSGNLKLKALYLNNIANILIELKKYNEALPLIDSGLIYSKNSEDKRSSVFLLSNKGKILLKRNKFDLAIKTYKQAVALSNETGVKDNYLNTQIGLGTAYYGLGRHEIAMSYLDEVMESAILDDNKKIIKETSEIMAKIHSAKADFDKAYQCLQLSNEMADSLSKSKIVKQFTQMEMQYDFDKKVYKNELLQQKINLENKQKLDRQRFFLYLFIFGFAAILFFVILIYRNYRMIRKLNAQLKNSIDKSTEQNRLIERKNHDLESLNDTKDKLFSIIAHDLNSPFNTILGFTEMFSAKYDNIDETKRKHYLKQIYQSSKDANNLLRNLLLWARSQKGNIEIEPELVELSAFVKSCLEPFLVRAKEKNLNITFDLPEIKFYLDKLTIQSILSNLFINAIKFTQVGGQISVSGYKQASSIEIKFSDDGVGIPKNRIKSLFKIGKNHSTLGTNNEKGTGLGLIICKDFIKKNGGKLIVESEVGKGSTFTVVLPLKSV